MKRFVNFFKENNGFYPSIIGQLWGNKKKSHRNFPAGLCLFNSFRIRYMKQSRGLV